MATSFTLQNDPALPQGYLKVDGSTSATFTTTSVIFPKIVSTTLASSTSYADDTAAASGGVAVGEFYRNGSVVQIRVS